MWESNSSGYVKSFVKRAPNSNATHGVQKKGSLGGWHTPVYNSYVDKVPLDDDHTTTLSTYGGEKDNGGHPTCDGKVCKSLALGCLGGVSALLLLSKISIRLVVIKGPCQKEEGNLFWSLSVYQTVVHFECSLILKSVLLVLGSPHGDSMGLFSKTVFLFISFCPGYQEIALFVQDSVLTASKRN